MSAGRCECGDPECASCGTAQGTRREVRRAYVYALRPGVWNEVTIAGLVGAGYRVTRLPPRTVIPGPVGATEDVT